MATGRPFTAKASVPLIIHAADSVGAHIAAKLSEFASDERTLTDEVCDMLCIWSQAFAISRSPASASSAWSGITFDVALRKTTTSEEVTTGADLELTVSSPLGSKTALIQAKVFESGKNSLRYDAKRDWSRLRKQLANAQRKVGDLAFLLLYVPADLLDRTNHGFGTWEQGLLAAARGSTTSSKFGTTFIPADALLSKRGSWRSTPPLTHAGQGRFSPSGISFTRLILEMLACRRGTWLRPAVTAALIDETRDSYPSYRRLDIAVGEPDEMSFERLSGVVRDRINELQL